MEPILNPDYWAKRLQLAPAHALHHAIFRCPLDQWLRIEAKHREILKGLIKDGDHILDVGCGWGRLLSLLPQEWHGVYRGIDISPDFIDLAEINYPGKYFSIMDFRFLPEIWTGVFDWAILISIRPMVKRNLGQEVWDQIEKELRKVSKKLLFLEYDESDEGSIE